MTNDELKILLGSSDVVFRRLAIDEIVMTFPKHADLFFHAFHKDDALTKEIANAALQLMPVLRNSFDMSADMFDSARKYSLFNDLAEFYSCFLREMREHLAGLDSATAQRTIDSLQHHFPCLCVEFGAVNYPKHEEHRQLMVFVTGRCNLHCPYCFSKELQKMSISKDDMLRVLSWAQRQNVQSLLPCGGEPLLYENMDWLIREAEQRSMNIYFATNLTVKMPDSMLMHNTISQLHVHLTDELFHDERLMATFRNNLRLCREKGINIILRGNIYGGDEDNHYEEWFGIAKEYGITAFNVAFTIPSHTGVNSFVNFETIQAMIPHLRHIFDLGRENNVRVSIAKPLPLCVFPEDMAFDILHHDSNATYCNVNEDGDGMHNLSLSTDLRFSPCLGIDNPSVPFSDDLEWNTLRSVFSPAVEALQKQPIFERCNDCFLYHRRLCQGACLSYKQTSRNVEK